MVHYYFLEPKNKIFFHELAAIIYSAGQTRGLLTIELFLLK